VTESESGSRHSACFVCGSGRLPGVGELYCVLSAPIAAPGVYLKTSAVIAMTVDIRQSHKLGPSCLA
jgi:hypothetical protein